MKSLHDFAGELRAAKKRLRRQSSVAAQRSVADKRRDLTSAQFRRKYGQPPDGRREWARERAERSADDYDTRRVSYAAEACKRAFGVFPVAVALPVTMWGPRPRRRHVEMMEMPRVSLCDESSSAAALTVKRHVIRVDIMCNQPGWSEADLHSAAWVQLADGGDWIDTRNLSGRHPMIRGRCP